MKTPASRLHERAQSRGWRLRFEIFRVPSAPLHRSLFSCQLTVHTGTTTRVFSGLGHSKKLAKHRAASEALQYRKPTPTPARSTCSTCPICLGEIGIRMELSPCGHAFCFGCISRWLDMKRVCPMCRVRVAH